MSLRRFRISRSTATVAGGGSPGEVEAVERFAFYDKIKGASVLVQSGEATAFGNAMFCKGVILN